MGGLKFYVSFSDCATPPLPAPQIATPTTMDQVGLTILCMFGMSISIVDSCYCLVRECMAMCNYYCMATLGDKLVCKK
jgi:hypothetical protein